MGILQVYDPKKNVWRSIADLSAKRWKCGLGRGGFKNTSHIVRLLEGFPQTSMFLTMFFKTQNIVQTMHLTMLIAHSWNGEPYLPLITNFQIKLMEWMCTPPPAFIFCHPLTLNNLSGAWRVLICSRWHGLSTGWILGRPS